MSASLLDLPVEIRKEIFEKCPKRDLVNLAVCSNFWREEVVPVIWNNVTVKWDNLVEKRIDTKTSNLKHTHQLTFRGTEASGYKNFAFTFIIHNCDPNQLTSLSVNGYIVPDGLELVAERLPLLRSIHLSGFDKKLTVDFFLHFEMLERVSLDGYRVSDDHVKNICQLKNLRVFELRDWRSTITGLSLEYISRVTELKELSLQDCMYRKSVIDHSLISKTIPTLRNLVRLEIPIFDIDKDFLKFAERDFRGLETLTMKYCLAPSLSLPCVLKLRNLKRLDLTECCGITSEAISSIHQLHNLEYLNLTNSDVTDEGIQHVSKLLSLRSLHLFQCEALTDVSLQSISQLQSLKVLNIGINDNYTDKGIAFVGNLQFLEVLQMANLCDLTDVSLKVVSTLSYLEELDISYCNGFTDDGLMHLAQLKYLKTLEVFENEGITEEGMKKAGF